MANILICDDDSRSVEYLRKLLSGEGYSVQSVTSASEAIQLITPGRFGAILLDLHLELHLEGMSGLEAIPVLKKIDPQLLIIALSDDDSLETEKKARMAGIFYYLIKPINDEEIRAVVRSAVRKSQG